MSDITKCNGKDCSKKYSCWRYTAPANKEWQAYAPFDQDPKPCVHYLPVDPQPTRKTNR